MGLEGILAVLNKFSTHSQIHAGSKSYGSDFLPALNPEVWESSAVRVAHFDCFSGIDSGDMTLAALFDIGVDRRSDLRRALASLGLPIEISIEKVRKGGFASTFIQVEAPEESTHRYLPEIEQILSRGGTLTT